MTDRLARIAGTITLTDGRSVEFSISPEGGYQQWGADDQRTYGDTQPVLEALEDGLREAELLSTEDEDDAQARWFLDQALTPKENR